MDPRQIAIDIYDAAMKICEPFSTLSENEKQTANQLMARFEEAEAKYGSLPLTEMIRPLLLSKNGRYQEASVVTEQYYRQSPSLETAVRAAHAAGQAGETERAVDLFFKGAEFDSDDLGCLMSIGNSRLEQDRCAEALEVYEKVLAKDPSNPNALLDAYYCRHRMGIDRDSLARLHEIAQQPKQVGSLEVCLTVVFGRCDYRDRVERAKYLLKKIDSKQGFQFELSSLILTTSLICVCLAILVALPGLGIAMTLIALLAYIRTFRQIRRSHWREITVDTAQKVMVFGQSLFVTIIIVGYTLVAMIASFVVAVFMLMPFRSEFAMGLVLLMTVGVGGLTARFLGRKLWPIEAVLSFKPF
jgi:tetratricopeptide (TPR) repeat protein